MSYAPTVKPLRVGVLYEETQMIDLAGLDILGNLTPKNRDMVADILPAFEHLRPLAIPMSFLYISSSLEPAWTTPEMYIKPTHTYANAPRDLDILLLGGPDFLTVKEESLKFLREASLQTKVVMTTRTGAMWLAKAGVLDGKKATTNRLLLDVAREMFPKVEWQDQRWVTEVGCVEGTQIWTSGAARCGIDMMIEYTHQNFDKRVVEMGCLGLDFEFEERSQFFKKPLISLAQ